MEALQQQGVFKSTTVTTGLAQRDTWQSCGRDVDIKFLAHYVGPGTNNKVNDWLVKQMKRAAARSPTCSRRTAS